MVGTMRAILSTGAHSACFQELITAAAIEPAARFDLYSNGGRRIYYEKSSSNYGQRQRF